MADYDKEKQPLKDQVKFAVSLNARHAVSGSDRAPEPGHGGRKRREGRDEIHPGHPRCAVLSTHTRAMRI